MSDRSTAEVAAATTRPLASPGGSADAASTDEVLEHHLSCFGACDLRGIMADYAPDAVLFLPDGPRRGTAEITRHFEWVFVEFGKPGASFAMTQKAIDGDYAYIVWTAETADNVYEVGTDTFVIHQGRILAQSYWGKVTPKRIPATPASQ